MSDVDVSPEAVKLLAWDAQNHGVTLAEEGWPEGAQLMEDIAAMLRALSARAEAAEARVKVLEEIVAEAIEWAEQDPDVLSPDGKRRIASWGTALGSAAT